MENNNNNNNNKQQQLDLGIISINNEGRVTIQLLLEEDLFSPLMKEALQGICNQLQILFNQVATELEEKNNNEDDK